MIIMFAVAFVALVIAVDALRRSVTSWNAVMAQRARSKDLLHLTGFTSEFDIAHRFGPPQKDGAYKVNIVEVAKHQSKSARVLCDPVFDLLIAVLVALSILSGSIPLMFSSSVFVILWHLIARDIAPRIEKGNFWPDQ
jgi:hypothetical protein